MKVALVGGLGFIGKHLVRKLRGSNTLYVFSDLLGAEQNRLFVKENALDVEVGDVADAKQIIDFLVSHKPDVVVHLAALTGIARCNADPKLAFSLNVLGTYNVVRGCVDSGARLIFTSSREVYGETLGADTRETDAFQPNNVYGLTKLLGEDIVRWAGSRYNLNFTILRFTNVYGPEGDQYGIQVIMKKSLSEDRIQVLGGNQIINCLYVGDVAEVISKCLTSSRVAGEVLNVGSPYNLSVEQVVQKIFQIIGKNAIIDFQPMREGETITFRPNLEKLEKLLGDVPATSVEDGLRKTIDWYRNTITAQAKA